MEGYARRGVFRGFSRGPVRGATAVFRLVWFRDRAFDLVVDTEKKCVMVPVVLPRVPDNIYRDFKAFVQSHHDSSLPDHRRIDRTRARLRCAKHGGNASVGLTVKDGDYAYALRRLIHLIHETFVIFLLDGAYRDYVVAQPGADADW
jgi:hypothetical protein